MLHNFLSSSNNIGRICASSSASLESILLREDLGTYLQTHRDNAKGPPAVLEFVERHFQKLLNSALQPDEVFKMTSSTKSTETTPSKLSLNDEKIALCVINATDLIYFYMNTSRAPVYDVDQIVPSVITALSKKHSLALPVAQCSRRLLLGAFEVNPVMTTKAIASTLNEKLVQGVIFGISTNFITADAIMAIFGSALRASDMVSPTTEMRMFTEAWIRCGFAQCLASRMAVALTSIECQAYFHFIKELLKRGFSHSAGPVIDVFMEYDNISRVMASVLEACEDAVSNPQRYPLLTCGVEVLHAVVTLVRQSLIAPDTKEMYAVNVALMSPIRFLQIHAQRFSDLLVMRKSSKVSFLPQRSRVEPVLVTLCEMFVELLRFHLHDTDQIVVRHRFLDKLLDLCSSYPECYRLTLFLQQALLAVFFRPLLMNDSNSEANVVLKHVIDQETIKSDEKGFLSNCVSICTDETLRHTSLSAFLIDVCHRLAQTPLFKTISGPLQDVIEPLLSSSCVMERIKNMEQPITGAQFTAVGSGGSERVRHRPLVNYAGSSLQKNDFLPSDTSINTPDSLPNSRIEGNGDGGSSGVCHDGDKTSRSISSSGRELFYMTRTINIDEEAVRSEAVDVEFSAMDALLLHTEDTVTVEPRWIDESMEIEVSPQVSAYPVFGELHLSFGVRGEDEFNEENNRHGIENVKNYSVRDPRFEQRGASVDSTDDEDTWVHETIAAMDDALGVAKES